MHRIKQTLLLFPILVLTLGGCAKAPPDVQLVSAILANDATATSQAISAGAAVNTPFAFEEKNRKFYPDEWYKAEPERKLPLTLAVWKGNDQAVKALLKAGADPNAVDFYYHFTPLMMCPSKEIATLLIQGGANVNLPLKGELYNGRLFKPTPLIVVVDGRRRDLVELLLKNGANVQGRDGEGKTAWRFTIPERPDIRQLLLSYGAKPNDSGPSDAKLAEIRKERKQKKDLLEKQQDLRDTLQMQKEDAAIDALMKNNPN